jgi:hypothetical protein
MPKKHALNKQAASFIDTMDCLPVSRLPEGPEWTYEIKLDGYRLEVVQSAGRTTLYSRRRNVLNQKFHYIATALKDLPDATVIDGELVALSPDGRPDLNLLQNFRSAESRIVYYAFDILIHKQRDLTDLPLSAQGALTPLSTGRFIGEAHKTTGRATIFKQADGTRSLRLTDFSTANCPQLHVLLVDGQNPDALKDFSLSAVRNVDLGEIKGNIGDQSYQVSTDVDLQRFNRVAIYCERFHANFGSATLEDF